jgi:hypothetical protein
MTYKITTSQLRTIIREAVRNALPSPNYEPVGETREKPEEKKARLQGKKQAKERLSGKSPDELKAIYLKLEEQAEQSYQDSAKHAFLWGALDQIRDMLKKMGETLPKKNSNPWTR